MDPELMAAFMELFGGQVAGPGVDKKGVPMPMNTTEQAKQNNFLQDYLKLLQDPQLAMFGAAMGVGTGSLDYMQFAEEQPAQQLPTAPVRSTYSLDALRNDPANAALADMIEQGASQSSINKFIRDTNLDDEQKADLIAETSSAVKEFNDYRTSAAQYEAEVANTPAPERVLSPMEEAFRKAGLPSPLEMFGADHFDQGKTEAFRQQLGAATSGLKSASANLGDTRAQGWLSRSRPDASMVDPFVPGAYQDTGMPEVEGGPGFADQIKQMLNMGHGGRGQGDNRPQEATAPPTTATLRPKSSWTAASSEAKATRAELASRDKARAGVVSAGRQMGEQAAYSRRMAELHARDGRTPLSEAMNQRVLLARSLGMNV